MNADEKYAMLGQLRDAIKRIDELESHVKDLLDVVHVLQDAHQKPIRACIGARG